MVDHQAMLQGVAFMGGEVFKVEKAHLGRESSFCCTKKKSPENRKNKVNLRPPLCHSLNQEDVNGEKPNGEKMVDFWCQFFSRSSANFFTVYADFSRFVRDINGEKKKHLLIDDLFHG